MPRLRRLLFRLAWGLSLCIALLAGALWVHGYRAVPLYFWQSGHYDQGSFENVRVYTCAGYWQISRTKMTRVRQVGAWRDEQSWLGVLPRSPRGDVPSWRTHTKFAWNNSRQGDPKRDHLDELSIVFPAWVPVAALLLPPGIAFALCRRRARKATGLCPICGYDLRASAVRCPECGTACEADRPNAPINPPAHSAAPPPAGTRTTPSSAGPARTG